MTPILKWICVAAIGAAAAWAGYGSFRRWGNEAHRDLNQAAIPYELDLGDKRPFRASDTSLAIYHPIDFATAETAFRMGGNLRKLTLTYDKLPRIPDRFEHLEKLEHLVLVGYDSAALPASIARSPKLTAITWTNSGLDQLPPVLARCPQLAHLHLEAMYDLEKLPDDLGNWSNLRAVMLVDLPRLRSGLEALGKARKLEALSIRNCPRLIPDFQHLQQNLKEFALNGNDSLAASLEQPDHRWAYQHCARDLDYSLLLSCMTRSYHVKLTAPEIGLMRLLERTPKGYASVRRLPK